MADDNDTLTATPYDKRLAMLSKAQKSPTTLVVANAKLSWLENGLPYSLDFEDTYHSSEGAQAESRYLFLEGNQLTQRWHNADAPSSHTTDCFIIAELGFGCGLNFLETLHLWTKAQSRPRRLHYLAFERHPLSHADLSRVLEQWPDLASYAAVLLGQYPEHSAGCHRLFFDNHVILDLHYGDALQRLNAITKKQDTAVDAWYLDGFSPSLNPSLWDLSIAHAMASHSKLGATATSYSVAGSARRALVEAGFSVTKRTGFGKKRHCLSAVFDNLAADSLAPFGEGAYTPPIVKRVEDHPLSLEKALPRQESTKMPNADYDVLVIGAGLAGCSTAFALSRRGLRVKIVDSAPRAMSGASGIPQLALRPRLFRSAENDASFFLNAYLTARRLYTHLDASISLSTKLDSQLDTPLSSQPAQTPANAWYPTGAVQFFEALNKKQPLTPEAIGALYDPRVVRSVSAEDASALAGLSVSAGGWHFDEAGWLDPHSLVKKLLTPESGIAIQFDTRITSLTNCMDDAAAGGARHWIATDSNGKQHRAETIVLCNSQAIDSLAPNLGIRVQTARGQASLIKAETNSAALRCVVSGERSLFPAHNGAQLIAASYRTDSESLKKRERCEIDDEQNLAGIAAVFAAPFSKGQSSEATSFGALEIAQAPSDAPPLVAIRSAGEDFLPVVGRAPAVDEIITNLAPLRRNAKAKIPAEMAYQEGLFVNVGHGSNGVATCPLSAEYLASLICKEPLPLSAAEAELVSPARFIVRDIKKQTR